MAAPPRRRAEPSGSSSLRSRSSQTRDATPFRKGQSVRPVRRRGFYMARALPWAPARQRDREPPCGALLTGRAAPLVTAHGTSDGRWRRTSATSAATLTRPRTTEIAVLVGRAPMTNTVDRRPQRRRRQPLGVELRRFDRRTSPTRAPSLWCGLCGAHATRSHHDEFSGQRGSQDHLASDRTHRFLSSIRRRRITDFRQPACARETP